MEAAEYTFASQDQEQNGRLSTLFWKAGPEVKLSSPRLPAELVWGEEVDGLIDLPVREIIDRLKVEFPAARGKTGTAHGPRRRRLVRGHLDLARFRVDCRGLAAEHRERLIDAIESFGCMAYDPSLPSDRRRSQEANMDCVSFASIATNGIHLNVAQAGPVDGPLLVLLHGFPDSGTAGERSSRPARRAGFRVSPPTSGATTRATGRRTLAITRSTSWPRTSRG